MPIVKVQMYQGRSHAQKAELARVITEAIVSIAHTTSEQTTVIFEDVSKENWAAGGVLASDSS
ncbi:MAG: tautomerase family protein [Chloroflexi bacterium]|nr:tautomerase family protein [Chloroflexota bacterium]